MSRAERTFNLADLFELVADAVPDREAVVCGPTRLTYRDLDERSTRLAHWLLDRAVGEGDRVALDLYNGPEYLEAMLAAFKIRAVPVNVNYRYRPEELRYLLDDSGASAVVAHASLAPTVAAALANAPGTLPVLLVGDESGASAPEATDYEVALSASSVDRDFPPRSSDDLYLLYTGGTTGAPKGVMWRQEDIFFAALGGGNPGGEPASTPHDVAEWAPHGRTRSLPASPFMHGTAHWMALAALFSGGSVVISPRRNLDAPGLWRLVADERVTFLTIVGDAFGRPLLDALDTCAATLDLGSLRVIMSGGAILSPAVKQGLADALPGAVVVDSYGSSETGGQARVVTVAGAPKAGEAFEVNDETALLDDDLRPVAEPGVVGRVARRGRVPLGYWNDPERTAATFPVVAGERWAVTGDFATLDAEGRVLLLGRGSVSINTGGEKVYPEEVEACLKGHPSVFDAVVVGVPDRRWGEKVVAVVQARPGHAVGLDELSAHVRKALAGYKAPRGAVVVEEILRTPSGKADYAWARDVARRDLDLAT